MADKLNNPTQPIDLTPRQCRAHSRSGNQCRAMAMHGGTVCRMHGGMAPQVMRKAAQRLAALIDPELPKIAQRIREGLDATHTKYFQKDGVVTDSRDLIAWGERRAAAELAMKALGITIEPDADAPPAISAEVVNIALVFETAELEKIKQRLLASSSVPSE